VSLIVTEPHEHLAEYETALSQLWVAYQRQGPGRLAAEELEPVERSFACLDLASWPQLATTLQQLQTLARRCVLRPEGLSFVTGEAGLLPRQDLHSAFDKSLARLRDELAQRD
jgi:hypothetical protein